MTKRFIKEGIKFEICEKKNGGVSLCYLGEVDDPLLQFITWGCDDEAEAMDLVDAIIDPERDVYVEYNKRHHEALGKSFEKCGF